MFDPDFFNDEGKPVRDHYAIKWLMKGTKKKPKIEEFKSRNWKGINPEAFSSDLHTLISPAISEPVDLVLHYNSVLENLRESHAPLVTKKKYRNLNPWYSQEIKAMKAKRRQLERKYIKSKSDIDHYNYKHYCGEYGKKLNLSVLNHNKKLVILVIFGPFEPYGVPG